MKALPVLSVVAGTLAFCSPALAHCGVTDLKLEQAISRKVELRQSANAVEGGAKSGHPAAMDQGSQTLILG